jgi:ATP-dependent Lhr-like helicase
MTTLPPSDSDSSGFQRLHSQVQRWIWQQGWTQLRDIQEQAIAPILENQDVIIAAATASGKTEAAFLPIFSQLLQTQPRPHGIEVLYLSPLKALINDQQERLSDLGDRLEIPVHPWHGDVSTTRKQKVLQVPSGILLMTPESLEALFIRRGHEIAKLFKALRYVVIDELHSFIGTERGQQLRSLLHRLESATQQRIPRIGLSATLGEMSLAQDYLRSEQSQNVVLIQSQDHHQEIKLQIRGYRRTMLWISDSESDGMSETSQDEIDIANHLFKVLRGDKNLIFINSRQSVEHYVDALTRLCELNRVPHEFMPHHGSLSKELREAAEAALKERDRPANVVCTSTLELGIDIGAVTSIAQVGTPYSVASTRQRLGRSGRNSDDPAILRLYITEPEITSNTPLEDTLHPSLVQAIAIINLLLKGWYEPPLVGQLHLSTLIQQVLSLIAERGGVRADQAWDILCGSGVFDAIDKPTFIVLLRCLGQEDLIQQSQDGLLLLGLKGERLVNHYTFYTAFKTPDEFRITTEGKTLGTLPIDYPVIEGSYLVFGGKRWQVLTIDRHHRVIDVQQAGTGRAPRFGGGIGLVHDRIRQEMLEIYTSETIPIFLDATARELLIEARQNFDAYDLVERSTVINEGQTFLFPWAGSTVMNTLYVLLLSEGIQVELGTISLAINSHSPKQLRNILKKLTNTSPFDAAELAQSVKNKLIEKHDIYLTEALLCQNYASHTLDIQTTWNILRKIAFTD